MARKNPKRKVRELETDPTQTSVEGKIREMYVTIKLMEKGYNVSLPVVNNRYDLIAEKSPNYMRIQVKNLKLDYDKNPEQPSSIKQWVIRAFVNHRGEKIVYDKDDVDFIFAINKESGDFAIVPTEKIPPSGVAKISVKSYRKEFLNSFKALDDYHPKYHS